MILSILRNILFILLFFSSYQIAQITKDDVKIVLELSGCNDESKIEKVWQCYKELSSNNKDDLLKGLGFSALSGIALGAYESSVFNYSHSEFLPGLMRNWYENRITSDGVFDKSLTWQKVWREVDYSTDRTAYNYFQKFFGDKWYLAIMSHWILKNTFATIIRDKMHYNEFFYSFSLKLLI